MFQNPNPTCDKDCRFQTGFTVTTAAYYPAIYDKNGVNVNPDGNMTTSEVTCSVCGKSWVSNTRYGKTEYKEINNETV